MRSRYSLLASGALLAAVLGGCSSSDGVSTSVGVSYGYGYGYGAPYYPGYYGPWYDYDDVVVVPPDRPGTGGDPGSRPKPLPTPPGGVTTLPAGPSALPSPTGPSAGYNSLPPPRSASAPRPTSRSAPRPAPRPTPRPMGGGGRRR